VLEEHLPDVLACFQEAVVASLVEPTCRALDDFDYRSLVLSGGVAANLRLRQRLHDEASRRGIRFHSPSIEYCTDNATMIAWAGWRRLQAGECDGLDLTGHANLPLTSTIDTSTAG
jgi:N6-L-threonylcarbamoyladenine synthase